MKITPVCLILTLTLIANLTQAKDNNLPSQSKTVSFTENKGQFADQNYNPRPDVLFGGSDGQLTFYITKKGVSYQLYRVDSYKEAEDPNTKEKIKVMDQQSVYRTDIKWLNANPNPLVKTDDALPGYSNYYLHQCPNGALNVKSYAGITLQNVYSGIDLHYYGAGGALKYDYIVAPNADYKQIQLRVEGAALKLQEDGSLLIVTPLGKIQEQAPVVFQNGLQLTARYTITNNTIGFEVDNYDSNHELIIDPLTRIWGTYYGGSDADEYGNSSSTDGSGNVFLCGTTASTGTLIATTGSHQSVNGNFWDAFLVKFNSSGVRSWGTYYGDIWDESALSCATDASGNVYLAGNTSSSGSVIATSGSHQSTYGGGTNDVFLAKFNSSGVRSWATHYGDATSELAGGCATDAFGNVYLAGVTGSSVGIATSGSHQSAMNGGPSGFLVKFNSSGLRLWGTYYGGEGGATGISCATDATGNVYLLGTAGSASGTMIATSGSHQSSNNGVTDSYIVKFNSSGVRLWGTFYGGAGQDYFYYCATDLNRNVYVAGFTSSNTGTAIATTGSHQSSHGGGTNDAFIVKFDSLGVRSWGSYYGGTGDDRARSCAVDVLGNIYLVGHTTSNSGTVIATAGSHQSASGGAKDGFLACFNAAGARQMGTYYGGASVDEGSSCIIDASGSLYLAGTTYTATGTAIATPGSHQSTYAGYYDAFLAKFFDCTVMTPTATVNGAVCSGGALSFAATISGTVTPTYSWSGPNSFTSAIQNPTIGGVTGLSAGVYTLSVMNGICVETATTIGVVHPLPSITVNSGSICSGNNFTIVPGGASTYSITGGSFIISPTVTNSYSISGTSTAGCISSNIISTVTVYTTPTVTANSGSICSGKSFTIVPSGASSYSISGSSFTVSPNNTTTYTISGTSTSGCVSGNAISTVTVHTTPTISVNSGSICSGGSFILVPSGAASYTYSNGSAIVSPLTSSTFSVSGTSTMGCISSAPAVATITVHQLPLVSVNSGTLCAGNIFTIVPTGASSYIFSNGSATVSPSGNTSYSVSGTSSAGCISASFAVANVTVISLPAISVNSGSICSGQNFTINPSGASTYSVTGGSFVVSPVVTSSYSISGTSTAGCVSATSAVSNVTVHSLPTISVNSGSICSGQNFTINPSGASTYSVTGGSFVVSPAVTSSYSISGTSTAGCVSSTSAVSNVTVHDIPTISVNSGSICAGDNFVIVPNGANSYTISGGSFTVAPALTTSYSVLGTNSLGCVSAQVVSLVQVDLCTGISENAKSAGRSVSLYPNPNNGVLYVESNEAATVRVIDLSGRVVYCGEISSGTTKFSLEHLSNGIYIMEVAYTQEKQLIRLVLQ
jgi:hypothetical protein